MNASAIICTRNRAASLRQTLESLASIDVPRGLRLEILVVDNDSTDDTAEVVRNYSPARIPTRYLSEPARGKSRALNTGMGASSSELILFTDDDVTVPKDWLELMCDPIVEKKGDAVAGRVELAPNLLRPWMTATHRAWLASTERLDVPEPSDMVGANMAFARSVLDVVPFFDAELGPGAIGLGEETLFALQLRKAGLKICRSSGSAVMHCFEERRLSRSGWLNAAKALGGSNGYLDYHWRHVSVSPAPLRIFRALARYYFWRLLKWRECLSQEGAPEWELWCLANLHRVVRYSVESRHPRNYDREGLVKIRGVMADTEPRAALEGQVMSSAS